MTRRSIKNAQKKLGGKLHTLTNVTSRNDAQIDRHTLRHYFEAMRRYKKWSLTMLISFSFTTIGFGVAIPFLFARAVDLIGQGHALTYGGPLANTLLAALTVAIVATISNGIGLRAVGKLEAAAQSYIRTKVFDRLMAESAAFYSNTKAGSLLGHVIAYTNGYSIVQEALFYRGLNLFLPLTVGLIVIATQSPLLAGILVVIALLISIKTLTDSKRRAIYRRARKEAMTRLNAFMGDVITNNTAVRTFAAEGQEKNRLLERQTAWAKAYEINLRIFGTHYRNLTGSVQALQVLGIGAAALLATTGRISLGLVVFTLAYFQRLSSGLLDLAPLVQSFQGALMDASPITEILLAPQTIVDAPNAKAIKVKRGAIAIKNVTHRYEKGSLAVFHNLNLTIPAGQSVGVVGRSGGGKTTLTNLLLRFTERDSGTITIDGQDITKVTQRSLRNAISYVPQDPQLFHRTIGENIAYGNPKASKKAVIEAAKRAHIWEFIKSLPQGLDTEVGERGLKLSGGQRQRIAIARAILKNAPIIILDEATSALDSESERFIQASMDELTKGRTSIIIAHRLSTIQKMNRIIVLEKGEITQDGTHETLASQAGLYATLWNHQSGGFIK